MIKKLNIMLDLETLGNKSNAVILSLGAVPFCSETGETGQPFYARISMDSQLKKGAVVNESTVLWWMQQNEKAREALVHEKSVDMSLALTEFKRYLQYLESEYGQPAALWGNGSRFDIGLLEDACVMQDIEPFWNFRLERDFRTWMEVYPEVRKSIEFKGTQHNPIDDCLHQIACVVEVYNRLANKDIIV